MRVKKSDEWLAAVGDRLEASRKAVGVSHVNMATVAGVSPQSWSNYVHGIRPLDLDAAILLCERWHFTLDWIYRGILAGLPQELHAKLAPRIAPKVVPLKKRR